MNALGTIPTGNDWRVREVQDLYTHEMIAGKVGDVLGLALPHGWRCPWKSPYRRPVVLEVQEGDVPRGYLFLWKVHLLGFDTGLLSDFQAPGIVTREEDRGKVLQASLEYIFNEIKIRKLELRVSPKEKEVLESCLELIFRKEKFNVISKEHRDRILDLPNDFEQLLSRWGYKMRRNVRHYLRLSEDNQWTYQSKLDWNNFCEDSLFLSRKSDLPKWEKQTLGNLNKLALIPGSFCAGLYKGSEPLSVIAGWHFGSKVMILFQLNLSQRSGLSLSMTLRALLIRELISQQVKQIIFLGGTREPLKSYSPIVPRYRWRVGRPSWFWDKIESMDRTGLWRFISFLPVVALKSDKAEEEAE
jgi:hypothetical protein